MTKTEIITKTSEYIKEKFSYEGTGHDWWHMYRVWKTATIIARREKANIFIVELGALLHDVADYKFHNGDEAIGGKVAAEWLKSLNLKKGDIDQVVHIVNNVSFKGGTKNKMKSLEGKIVQDADRLDAIGAIGIARCFAYGGSVGSTIYDPEIKPRLSITKEEYKQSKGTQINHFYEKLLLLKNLMNTKNGIKMAEKRHRYMENFLDEFYLEWDGKK